MNLHKQIFFCLFIVCLFPITLFAAMLTAKERLNNITHKKINNYSHLRYPSSLSGRLNSGSCSEANTGTCTAVGFKIMNKQLYPLLLRSINGGIFSMIDSVPHSPGTLLSTSCAGIGNQAMCVAVGYLGDKKENGIPLLMQSIDDGFNWTQLNIPNVSKAILKEVSCQAENKVNCVAIGAILPTLTSPSEILIYRTANGGLSWERIKVANFHGLGNLNKINCEGKLCIAIGHDHHNHLFVIQTRDSGKTWINQSHLFSEKNLQLSDISCTQLDNDRYNNVACAIVGRINHSANHFAPAIYQTKNNADTWIKNTAIEFPNSQVGELYSVKCTEKVNKLFCVAVGRKSLDPSNMKNKNNKIVSIFSPLVLQTDMSSNKWITKTIEGAGSNWNSLLSVNCLINGTNEVCFAVGFSDIDYGSDAILALSTADADTWKAHFFSPFSQPGVLRNINCVKNSSFCLAVGNSIGSDKPLIIATVDGNSWGTQAVSSSQCGLPSPFGGLQCDITGINCTKIEAGSSMLASYSKGGCDWQRSNVLDLPDKEASLENLVCNDTFSACVAIGNFFDQDGINYSLLGSTQNGGETWRIYSVEGDYIWGIDTTNLKGDHWTVMGKSSWPKPFFAYWSDDNGLHWHESQVPFCDSSGPHGMMCNKLSHTCYAQAGAACRFLSKDEGKNWTLTS